MLATCGCYCGSTDNLIRNFLKAHGYQDWMTIPIAKGKERSRAMLNILPQYPEVQMLDNFLKDASKWAVIIGWDDTSCRWADIAHGGPKAGIDAGFLVDQFGK